MTASASNMVIGFRRHTHAFTFANAGGSWDPDYPLSNLEDDELAWVARAASTTEGHATFQATSDVPVPIGMFGFVDHNGDPGSQYRVQFFSSTTLTTPFRVYDSGWSDFHAYVFPPESVSYGDPRLFGGRYQPSDIEERINTTGVWLGGTKYLVQGVMVQVRFQTSAPWECAVFDLAEGWQVRINFAPGSARGPVSRSRVTQAKGGKKYIQRETQAHNWTGTIEYMKRDESRARAWEMFVEHDKDIPFLVMPHPTETDQTRDTGFFRNEEIEQLVYQNATRDRVSFRFQSVI